MAFGKRGLQEQVEEQQPEGFIKRYTKTKAERRAIASILIIGILANALIFWAASDDATMTPAERAERERVRQERIAAEEKEEEQRQLARQQAAYNKVCGTGNSIAACVMMQDAVRSRLKAPSTASFPYSNNAAILPAGDCSWEVLSYVDAQNGFGATIRSAWVGKIRHYPTYWSLACTFSQNSELKHLG